MFLDSIMQRCNIYIMSKYLILLPILSLSFVIAQEEEEDINLDDLWDTTVWEEIEEINEVEGEVEQVVTVAGVRGAEAEDEALHHLYYRLSAMVYPHLLSPLTLILSFDHQYHK